jgi:hypothetical protein
MNDTTQIRNMTKIAEIKRAKLKKTKNKELATIRKAEIKRAKLEATKNKEKEIKAKAAARSKQNRLQKKVKKCVT